jgi:hypothetical protein
VGDVDGRQKLARKSDQIGPHAINNMGMEDGNKSMEEVELDNDKEGFDGIASAFNKNYNILIPQLSFKHFLVTIFVVNIVTDNLGIDQSW